MPDPDPITFAPPSAPSGFANRVAERWRLRRERRRWLGEMAGLATLGRLDELLHDVGMTRADLDFLIAGPADGGRQFAEMAAAEQVDLHRPPAEVLRQATWACARCHCRAPCQRWLRTGVWEYGGDPRCPNAALLRH